MNRILLFASTCCFSLISLSQTSPLWTRYPSISPDGSKIAFSYQGDIYVVNADGGLATQLTSHPDHDYMPVWSNNGEQLAFASNRYGNFDVFIMSADGGKATRLTYHSFNDSPYSFSADDSEIFFSSLRHDGKDSKLFPSGVLTELYSVPSKGGNAKQVLGIPAEDVSVSEDGTYMYYHDKKGYEDPWRKHHTSYITRDVWRYEPSKGQHTQITDWLGEDRNPVTVGDRLYFLSERTASTFNIYEADLDGKNVNQLTTFAEHPVRFLSASKDHKLCFFYNGEIYTISKGNPAKKVEIQIASDINIDEEVNVAIKNGLTEYDVASNGKEIAFIVRGEVFVSSIDFKNTKRITNTAEQERSVSFSPDGKKVLYASERNGSWDVYETSIKNEDEKYFFMSTVLVEKQITKKANACFQPAYSPNGKEVAYLRDRTALEVINLETNKTRVLLESGVNYSYSDGDQWFEWSPDSKWITLSYIDNNRWMSDVAVVNVTGTPKVRNLTESGYGEGGPTWVMDGNAIAFSSDRYGRRAHASWGADEDVCILYLNQKTYDKYHMDDAEYELTYKEKKSKNGEAKNEEKKDESEQKKVEDIKIEFDDIKDRTDRLTIHSSRVSGFVISKDGESLYYLSKFEKGYDLWKQSLTKKETKLVQKLGMAYGLEQSEDGKALFVLENGGIQQLKFAGEKIAKKPVTIKGTMVYKPFKEREFMYYHAWQQVVDKFYLEDLHGVKWDMYKDAYARFLPHITNGIDFSEMLSELLGELNASHTGARYRAQSDNQTATAYLGLIPDLAYNGAGIKVDEVLAKGPLDKHNIEIASGDIITHINGNKLDAATNINQVLNGLIGQNTLLSIKGKDDVRMMPISQWEQMDLMYHRWVKKNQEFTEEYSKGKIAYVHVKGMNESSYRAVYSDLLGKYNDYDAVVVDTRFNGGGWLHDNLATLLSGKQYMIFSPRGQENMGGEPMFKWKQASAVLMSEGNYSDAHMFPYTYKALGIGKLVGMPVAGTGTAVWWETQIDGKTVFGIPQVGMKGNDGKLLENQTLMPDIQVANDPHTVTKGEDKQLKAAIDELMK